MTRMYRPRPTPCGREQERVARKRTDVSRETSGGGDGAPCGGDLRGGGALRGRATSSQWQKAFEFGISSCLFAAQESGTLAKRLVVENHAPTSRIVPENIQHFCKSCMLSKIEFHHTFHSCFMKSIYHISKFLCRILCCTKSCLWRKIAGIFCITPAIHSLICRSFF